MERRSERNRWIHAILLAAWAMLAAGAAPAQGGGPGSVRKQIESSLLVSGKIEIEPDGSVSKVVLDQQEKLPEGVVGFVRDSALQWRFEPVVVDGKVVRARAPMNVRVVAKKIEDDQYRIEIRGASFEDYDPLSRENVTSDRKMTPPDYPLAAARAGAGGDVYLLLKVGRDGSVEDAVAEQVNLRVVATENEMRKFRKVLADSSIAAARKWKFRPPSEGAHLADPFWVVRVPVSFRLGNESGIDQYGRWTSYVPGPREQVPWRSQKDRAEFSPDALVNGGVYMADSHGPRLLTPLHGG